MKAVSRFEAHLLRLLYYFLRREPPEQALPLVEARITRPPCLSRDAVELVQQALAKGCVHLLARLGGWRKERYVRGERVADGRLWQRTQPEELGLSFSRHTLDFLVWITAARPGDKDTQWHPAENTLTPADRLLLYFAHEGLRPSPESVGVPKLRERQPYVQHGLCRLAYPEDFTAVPAEQLPNFAPWTEGLGACMLEALQPELLGRWVHLEGEKATEVNPERMRAIGQSQERALGAFLAAVEKAGRYDLARFLLRAAAHLLGPSAEPRLWVGGLNTAGLRLADRAATYQAALAFVRCLGRLKGWERRARVVGYFDEGYHASQLWLADWEQHEGDQLHQRAEALIRQLDPMQSA